MSQNKKQYDTELLDDTDSLEEFEIVENAPSKEEKIKEEPKKKWTPNFYLEYTPRIIIDCILVLVFSCLAIITLYHSFEVGDLVNVRYNEKSSTFYQVFNGEEEIQKEDKIYDSSQIQSIKGKMEYHFEMNKTTSLVFKNQVVGNLIILDKNNPDKVLYQETYPLTEMEETSIEREKELSLSKEFEFNYQNYNSIAQKFSKSYGVETESFLEVGYTIQYKNNSKTAYSLEGESKATLKIPLETASIKIEETPINSEKRVNKKPNIYLKKPGLLILGLIISIGAILCLSDVMFLEYTTRETKDIYDRTIQKILKKHKEYIQPIKKIPTRRGKRIIRVKTFKDLWEIRKRVKGFILYNNIAEHTKCEFYINEHDKLYILTIKKVDLEKKINK